MSWCFSVHSGYNRLRTSSRHGESKSQTLSNPNATCNTKCMASIYHNHHPEPRHGEVEAPRGCDCWEHIAYIQQYNASTHVSSRRWELGARKDRSPHKAAETAMAASTALPPDRRILAPISVACWGKMHTKPSLRQEGEWGTHRAGCV